MFVAQWCPLTPISRETFSSILHVSNQRVNLLFQGFVFYINGPYLQARWPLVSNANRTEFLTKLLIKL